MLTGQLRSFTKIKFKRDNVTQDKQVYKDVATHEIDVYKKFSATQTMSISMKGKKIMLTSAPTLSSLMRWVGTYPLAAWWTP